MSDNINKVQSMQATIDHKVNVEKFMKPMITELIGRSIRHDDSKLKSPELETFAEYGPKLKTLTYGSEEYKTCLSEIKPALDHHYANNRHHPEYFEKGILGMNLVDLTEMIADWMAAVLRHDNGDINESLDINQKRFGYSDDLKQILKNTVAFIKSTERED